LPTTSVPLSVSHAGVATSAWTIFVLAGRPRRVSSPSQAAQSARTRVPRAVGRSRGTTPGHPTLIAMAA
jgi:hypothetical protein